MKSKVKQNRYKPEAVKSAAEYHPGTGIDFCLKWIMLVAGISLFSLAMIFMYDLVTQAPVFNVKTVHVSGNQRVSEDEVKSFAGLDGPMNMFKINLNSVEARLASHPWIEKVHVKRNIHCELFIHVIEHQALAIVKIENIADIIINEKGIPFKEYDPMQDRLEALPIITGLDLTLSGPDYLFDGILFNAVMDYLDITGAKADLKIHADDQMGLTIEARDTLRKESSPENRTIKIKMGFDNYRQKIKKAKHISAYIEKFFPGKTITAMDLFNLKKVFIRTELSDPECITTEKGV